MRYADYWCVPGCRNQVTPLVWRTAVHKSDSHATLCWREMDSNHRYPEREACFFPGRNSLAGTASGRLSSSTPGTGILQTHRWREMDSNHRYPANFFGAPSDPHAIRLPKNKPASLATGTDGLNPSPSTAESASNRAPTPIPLALSPDPVNFVTVMYARPAARAGTRLARHSAAVGQGLAPCPAPPHGR
jgi:hypothetical protein